MSFRPEEYLRHILTEADFLIGRSQGLDGAGFASDETLRRAFVRSLEIIGEAAKKLPASFCEQHPQIEWSQMAWDVVKHKIPALRAEVARLLQPRS
jgi:uncharacterized protein with HEPN domain